ncbi:MAG: hypothetical protein HC876_04235 [Chloroflexaceae bacterium]|nr:hypothetical protein [Chloroflexaceae bacterium]
MLGIIMLTNAWQQVFAAPLISPPVSDLQQTPTFTFTQDAVTVDPSSTIEVQATLVNTSSNTDTFNITTNIATLPGWTVQILPSDNISIRLAGNAATTVTFQVTAPDTANGGSSEVFTATAVRGSNTAETATDTITINLTAPTDTPTNTNTPDPTNLQIQLREGEREREATPGSNVTYRLRVVNQGSQRTTFSIRFDNVLRCSDSIPDCTENFSGSTTNIGIDPGAGFDFDVTIRLPNDAPVGASGDTRVEAVVNGQPVTSIILGLEVIEATPTPTPTDTPTRTPTPSQTPTQTPTLGPICRDPFEGDDDRNSAKLILVNLPQPQDPVRQENEDRRAICPGGDEDWLYFGAIENKVYTIDVRDVAPGLDLSLELTDEEGNQLAFNDDFFPRSESLPGRIDPRIASWRAPATGIYYIRVRDVSDNGGTDLTYRIEVIDESYGPTPQLVEEICFDLFEPDGLPEQAPLITSNERHFDHRLCPAGDADWVTFFGKANKRYFIYTDTRPYFDDNPAPRNRNAQVGADTVMTLKDRDGVTIIDINDDIPGGQTLDSQIEFIPEVDGFYYVQVKNVGDIGNQFIRYDLVLELCIPGQADCGRTFVLPATSTPIGNGEPTATPTLTEEFDLDATETPTETPTQEFG